MVMQILAITKVRKVEVGLVCMAWHRMGKDCIAVVTAMDTPSRSSNMLYA